MVFERSFHHDNKNIVIFSKIEDKQLDVDLPLFFGSAFLAIVTSLTLPMSLNSYKKSNTKSKFTRCAVNNTRGLASCCRRPTIEVHCSAKSRVQATNLDWNLKFIIH